MNALRTTPRFRLTWRHAVLSAVLLLLATHALAQAPPATPSSVTLTRANGTVTADWPAVSGATKYHVTYSTDNGGSWHAPVNNHTNWTSSSITFKADNAKPYVGGVRAGNNDGQWSGWRNSPASGPYAPPAPGPVASVTVTRSDGTLTATWDAPANAAAYHVTYSTNNGASWSLGALDHTPTAWTLSNADNAKTYVVGVRARNSANDWSGWRNSPASGPYTPPQLPPAAPAGLAASAGDGSVTVSWSSPGDSSITGYEYRSRYAGVAWSAWTAVSGSGAGTTSFTLDGLTNGTEYRVKLRAANAHGTSAAAPVAAPWYVAATPKAAVPPGAPTSITVTRSNGALTASWPAVAGATGYRVEYSAVGNGNWTTAAANQTATSITISGVNNDHTYLVGASASNPAGQSASSVSPPAGPYSQKPPLAPPSVTVLRADGELTAFWNSGYGAEDYHVTYSADYGKSWSLAARNHPVGNGTTEITIKNLDNAKQYTVGVRARNKNGYSGWRNSSPSGPYVPIAAPPKPKNPSAYPGDKTVVFIWERPEWEKPVKPGGVEVTGYQAAYWLNPGVCAWPADVKWYNISGSNGDTVYHAIIGHHVENGEFKPGLKNGVQYGVALRAMNQHVPGPGVAGCRTPSADASPPPLVPPAPENLNLIRGDGTLTVTWHHARTASGYQVDYSTNGGQSWMMAVWWNNTTSTTLRGMDNNVAYTVRVRGRNNRGDGAWSASVTDTPPVSLSASGVGATKATLTLAHYTGGAWYYQSHTSANTGSCEGPVASGTTTKILTGLTNGKSYTYKAYSDSSCATEIGAASFTTLTPNLAVSNVARTSATLTLTGWTAGSGSGDDGVWYYKRDTGSCSTAQSAATADLTGLTVNTDYTYKAYTDSGCVTELVAADGFYTGDTVSNLGATKANSVNLGQVTTSNIKVAAGFTTGSNSHGYTLEKITAKFDAKVGSPAGFTAAIHAASSGSPAATATCTLTGSAPDAAGRYLYPPSTTCNLSASTTYFLVLSATGTAGGLHYYRWNLTDSNDQTNTPSNAGWTFADSGKSKVDSHGWANLTSARAPLFEVKAAVKPPPPSLSVTNIDATTATLNIANHNGNWYFKGFTASSQYACIGPISTSTKILSSSYTLTANTLYGITAYSAASCNTALDTAYFSTTDAFVGNLTEANPSSCVIGHVNNTVSCAMAFTTGNAANGYTLGAVTARFDAKQGAPGDIVAAIHAADTSNSSNPAATASITLSGSDPDAAGLHAYTCSSGCDLARNTTYFVVFSSPTTTSGINYYSWKVSTSDDEYLWPTGSGWALANAGRFKEGSAAWGAMNNNTTGVMHVQADAKTSGQSGNQANQQAGTTRVAGWRIERDAAGVLKVTAGTNPAPAAGSRTATASVAARAVAAPAPGSRDEGNDVNTLAAAGNTAPDGVWADGATLWVVDADDRMLYAYDLAAKTRDPGKDVSLSRNARPLGLASDGVTLWVSDYQDGTVYAYPVPGTPAAPGPDVTLHADNASPSALWTDGATLWVAEDGDGRLYAYDLPGGARDPGKDVTLHEDNASSGGLWSDGVTMWVSDPDDGMVYAYRLSDGRRDASKDYDVGGEAVLVYGLWSDGTTTWIADDGSDTLLAHHAH